MARLDIIRNWLELAKRADWSAINLAKECGSSKRTLERHFVKNFGKSPKKWLIEQRQQQGVEIL